MTPGELTKILQLGESQDVEYKTHCRANIIGASVSALLNRSGGYVVCGARDGGDIAAWFM